MDETKDTREVMDNQEDREIADTQEAPEIADDQEIVDAQEAAETEDDQDIQEESEAPDDQANSEDQDVPDAAEIQEDQEIEEAPEPAAPKKQTRYAGKHIRKDSGPGKRFIISTIIIVVLAGAIGFGLFKLWNWYTDNQSSNGQKDEARSHVTVISEPQTVDGVEVADVKYDIDFDGLKAMNSDTVAWLKVEGTEIEYPVVHAGDNSYYLTYSYDGSYNNAGWVFADYRDACDGSDRNLVIYGHNRRDGSMFGSLHSVFSDEWLDKESNRYIVLVTEKEYCIYEVFSIYSIPVEDYYITTSFGSDSEFEEFLNVIKDRSQYDFGVELSGKDKILTLSTCSNMDAHRVVLHAKKLSAIQNK